MVHENKNKQPGKRQVAAKLHEAKIQFASTIQAVTDATDAVHRTAQGNASPEQVAQVLNDKIIPALEGVTNTIKAVEEALPVEDELGDEDEMEPEEMGLEEEPRIANLEENPAFKELKAKFEQIRSENLAMKKANLAKRYAAAFPPQMRDAMEKEFMKDHEKDEDLDKMEAKVASVEKTVNAYKTAGLINKTRIPLTHMAKDNLMRTAKQGEPLTAIPWYMR